MIAASKGKAAAKKDGAGRRQPVPFDDALRRMLNAPLKKKPKQAKKPK